MDDYNDEMVIAASSVILTCAAELADADNKKRRERFVWVRPWLAYRETLGAYQALVLEFADREHDEYRRFMRMDPETFQVNM